jgi:hypothetical protein
MCGLYEFEPGAAVQLIAECRSCRADALCLGYIVHHARLKLKQILPDAR